MLRHAEPVMGTVVSFDVRGGELSAADLSAALVDACRVLHAADETFSTYRPHSPMSRLRRGELALAAAPDDVVEVLGHCARARELSGGWFDADRQPGGVDPTGLVKGWAAQRAAQRLREAGVAAAMVNAAGDVACFGEPDGGPWRIGIQDPTDRELLLCVVEVPAAIATSGRYERGDHVIDVHDGTPARRALSATVTGPDLTYADALATALLAAGPQLLGWLTRLDGYEALVMDPEGRLSATAGFRATGADLPTC